MRWWIIGFSAASVACTGGEQEDRCGSELAPAVELGQGVGGAFAPFTTEAPVSLDIAPQGGFGVTAQVQTIGMLSGPATVTVRTEIDGAPSGEFTFEDDQGNPTLQIFCRDDGRGTLGSGVAVGFDPDTYTQDNLTDLDGQVADLVVDVVDGTGEMASGRATVTILVGG